MMSGLETHGGQRSKRYTDEIHITAFYVITAFPADESYLAKIRQESGLVEIKKPQS